MRAMPAGSAMNVRTTGNRRATNTMIGAAACEPAVDALELVRRDEEAHPARRSRNGRPSQAPTK